MSPHLSEKVERKILRYWVNDDDRDQVRHGLRQYGSEVYLGELERVHLAILKLSDGSLEKFFITLDAAKIDYRDVLLSAEFPEEGLFGWPRDSAARDSAELAAIRRRDREQYETWLKE